MLLGILIPNFYESQVSRCIPLHAPDRTRAADTSSKQRISAPSSRESCQAERAAAQSRSKLNALTAKTQLMMRTRLELPPRLIKPQFLLTVRHAELHARELLDTFEVRP